MNKHLAILRKGAREVAPVVLILGGTVGMFTVTYWAFGWAMEHHHLPVMIITWCAVALVAITYVAGLD